MLCDAAQAEQECSKLLCATVSWATPGKCVQTALETLVAVQRSWPELTNQTERVLYKHRVRCRMKKQSRDSGTWSIRCDVDILGDSQKGSIQGGLSPGLAL